MESIDPVLGASKERLQARLRDAVEQSDAKRVAELLRTKVAAYFRLRRRVVAESRNREEGQRFSDGITPEEVVTFFAEVVKPDSPEAFRNLLHQFRTDGLICKNEDGGEEMAKNPWRPSFKTRKPWSAS